MKTVLMLKSTSKNSLFPTICLGDQTAERERDCVLENERERQTERQRERKSVGKCVDRKTMERKRKTETVFCVSITASKPDHQLAYLKWGDGILVLNRLEY